MNPASGYRSESDVTRVVQPALAESGRSLNASEVGIAQAARSVPAESQTSRSSAMPTTSTWNLAPATGDGEIRAEAVARTAGRTPAPERHDSFAHVRIHTGPAAAISAAALRARAYTAGSDIVMGGGDAGAGREELLAHELAHAESPDQAPGLVERRVTPDYPQIEDRLSYEVFDWAITDEEAHACLLILDGLSDRDLADTVAAMDRDGLVERLLDNIPDDDRERYAVLIARITRRRSVARSSERIIDRLSYGIFDWAVTDQDARDALQVLMGLESQQLRTTIARLVNAGVFDRLLDNLPREEHRRFAAFIARLREIRDEFAGLVAAHLTFLRGRPGGAGEEVRRRVEATGYGGSPSTWDDLDAAAQEDWRRRARVAIRAVTLSLRGTDLEPILARSELVFEPAEAERNNAYAYVSGVNRLFFGRSWVRDAEEDVRNVWQSIAHELGGHDEFGNTWSWQIMEAAVAGLTPQERRRALGTANSLYSAYGYLETELYAELREEPYRIETSGGDRPEMDVRRQLQRVQEAFGPVVGRQIALRLYYRVLDDPRIDESARRLLYSAVQEVFGLFPVTEAIRP
jgi:hypothetical protein